MRRAFWQDVLPGLIAAGLLSCGEVLLLGHPTWQVPLAGYLAASTVYIADHRIPATGKAPPRIWCWIALRCGALGMLLLTCPRFNLLPILLYLGLALGYVLHLPGTTVRLQEHPWLRVTLVSAGWGCVPLILNGLPLTSSTLGFLLGNTSLFLAGVMWSDLSDREEDRAQHRITPAQQLSPRHFKRIVTAAYAISAGAYVLSGFPILGVASLLGGGLIPGSEKQRLLPYTDALLLWPGLCVLPLLF